MGKMFKASNFKIYHMIHVVIRVKRNETIEEIK